MDLPEIQQHVTAFAGAQRLAAGPLPQVTAQVQAAWQRVPALAVLVFDDATGEQIDIDPRFAVRTAGQSDPAAAPPSPVHAPAPRTAGRPRLGVVAREVTLLPRHWAWLAAQPGGASVALRKLVETARRDAGDTDTTRTAQEACYRFLSAMAGNLPGFEEAARALFAGDAERFQGQTQAWPPDVRDYAWRLGFAAFGSPV
jgi:uncharacterized protein